MNTGTSLKLKRRESVWIGNREKLTHLQDHQVNVTWEPVELYPQLPREDPTLLTLSLPLLLVSSQSKQEKDTGRINMSEHLSLFRQCSWTDDGIFSLQIIDRTHTLSTITHTAAKELSGITLRPRTSCSTCQHMFGITMRRRACGP